MTENDIRKMVSMQLTEVRTVLSRSRTALDVLKRHQTTPVEYGRWDHTVQPPKYIPPVRVEHPYIEEMMEALVDVINALEPYERRSRGQVEF